MKKSAKKKKRPLPAIVTLVGRPPKEISAKKVERMARAGARICDIAEVFSVSRDTIERRFRREIERGKAWLRVKLAEAQTLSALSGNMVMQIWLGKQYLDQKEPGKDLGPPPPPPAKPYGKEVSNADLKKAARRLNAEAH